MSSLKTRLRRRRIAEAMRRRPRLAFLLLLTLGAWLHWAAEAPQTHRYLTGIEEECSRLTAWAEEKAAALFAGEDAAPVPTEAASPPQDAHAAAYIPAEVEKSSVLSRLLPLLWGGAKSSPAAEAAGLTLAPASALEYKNCTAYSISPAGIMEGSRPILIDSTGPQVLVIHTHGSEAYTPSGEDIYEESDPYRTTDEAYNMVRIGDELCSILEARGIPTVHDRTLFDYPNYNGSYERAMEAIEGWLEEYPSIKIVLDLHRDAIEYSDGSAYRTHCSINGEDSAQILIISGTDDSGLYHPNWQSNLAFGFTLQSGMDGVYPGLTRPLKISQYRYNMQATAGSLLIEVGSHGNTLSEALVAIRCFGDILARVLLEA